MGKRDLLVSFSGGETSAFMGQWLWKNAKNKYNMVFVFANTGEENEETLEFIENCSKHFGFKVYWVEAVVHHGKRKAPTHKIVDFKTASRKGQPFADVIHKYGIPNKSYKHCNRDLKLNPIKSFAREYFGHKDYLSAIGIRVDEIDRVNKDHKEFKLVYPLALENPTTKKQINAFWKFQPFRLELKGYQGNCKTCWKKSDKKLYKIYEENPAHFLFFSEMELLYPRKGSEFKKDPDAPDRVFFRGRRSVEDLIEDAEKAIKKGIDVVDDSDLYDDESCDIYSSCGD